MTANSQLQLQEWGQALTPDSARSLIRLYRESEWRGLRLEVIQTLGRFQDSRSFQFLAEIIENNQDLAEQELALLSMGQRRNKLAQGFLRRFYTEAPDTLRAATAYAAGLAQIFSLSENLLRDFDEAWAKQDLVWLKNLILALGEMKEFKARVKIKRLLAEQTRTPSDLSLAALFALGRLERDPDTLKQDEYRYFQDSLAHQVFQSALSQIQIRSQFKLEDYLSKIFESAEPHPVLPLELKAFDPAEVLLGISLFPVEQYSERYLFALRGLPLAAQAELAVQAYSASPDKKKFFSLIASHVENTKSIYSALKPLAADSLQDPETRLRYCQAFSNEIDYLSEAEIFLSSELRDEFSIPFLNLWNDAALAKPKTAVKKELSALSSKFDLIDTARARLIRACVELGLAEKNISDSYASLFAKPGLRSSLLLYAEAFQLPVAVKLVSQLSKTELETLGVRVLGLLEQVGEANDLERLLSQYENQADLEWMVSVLRVLRRVPLARFEKYAVAKAEHSNELVALNAVIALKNYPASRAASEVLALKLESPSLVLQGRALDSLCAHSSLLGKRAIMRYLSEHLAEESVVDKIYRSFDPENKGGEEYAQVLNQILSQNPDHPQWEKLVSLRDRLSTQASKDAVLSLNTSPELEAIDLRLRTAIPKFDRLDLTTKLALRAAEQPFLQVGDGENLPIDKAPTVLEYCKALDLILERHLGQKLLFPKLDRELHDFQTLWHRVGFGEDYPQADRVLGLLGLKGKLTVENFPLHKAKMMCGTFFNGKILQDRFKIFDGLRAWAVIFLVFSRKISLTTGAVGPLLKLPNITDEQCISVARRLMVLQDLRNPAAHRQTYNDLGSVKTVRNEAIDLVNVLMELV